MKTFPAPPRFSKGVAALAALEQRERQHMLHEVAQMRGLMPLLMKRRNGRGWSASERAELRLYRQRLSALSPYLLPLILPGGFLLLPLLAWWLDRRRQRREPPDHLHPA